MASAPPSKPQARPTDETLNRGTNTAMSGKKKLARKSVVLVSSRRGQGRRRVRPGVKRQAIRQIILNGVIVIVAVMIIEVLFQIGVSHEVAIARRDSVVPSGKSLAQGKCDLETCIHQVINHDYYRSYAQ